MAHKDFCSDGRALHGFVRFCLRGDSCLRGSYPHCRQVPQWIDEEGPDEDVPYREYRKVDCECVEEDGGGPLWGQARGDHNKSLEDSRRDEIDQTLFCRRHLGVVLKGTLGLDDLFILVFLIELLVI